MVTTSLFGVQLLANVSNYYAQFAHFCSCVRTS